MLPALSLSIVKHNGFTRCLASNSVQVSGAPRALPFPPRARAHTPGLTRVPRPETRKPGAWLLTRLHARTPGPAPRSLSPAPHTQGIKQESIQGTVPTAQAGSRGKNNTTSLFLTKMKQESSSRPWGAGGTGLGLRGEMTRLPCGGQVGHPPARTSTPPGCAGPHGQSAPPRRDLAEPIHLVYPPRWQAGGHEVPALGGQGRACACT